MAEVRMTVDAHTPATDDPLRLHHQPVVRVPLNLSGVGYVADPPLNLIYVLIYLQLGSRVVRKLVILCKE